MKIFFAHNLHRGGGGAKNAAEATITTLRQAGHEVALFIRDASDIQPGLLGRLSAATDAFIGRKVMHQFGQKLDAFQPDVVHLHETFPLLPPWIMNECHRRQIPVVMTCVDYRLTCPVTTHYRKGKVCTACIERGNHCAVIYNCRKALAESVTMAAYRSMCGATDIFRKRVAHFIAPSPFTRDWLIEHARIDPQRISTICPVVDIPPTPADASQGQYVAYAGRLAPHKGIDILIDAARQAQVPLKLSCHVNNIESPELPEDVEVVRTSSRAELESFYRGARCLVMPSLWFETFGLVGAEAMSHGIPVIASRIGAVENLVEHEVDGLHVAPGNVAELADAIRQMWNNPMRCKQMGLAGREKVATQWHAQEHLKQTLAVYDQANTLISSCD